MKITIRKPAIRTYKIAHQILSTHKDNFNNYLVRHNIPSSVDRKDLPPINKNKDVPVLDIDKSVEPAGEGNDEVIELDAFDDVIASVHEPDDYDSGHKDDRFSHLIVKDIFEESEAEYILGSGVSRSHRSGLDQWPSFSNQRNLQSLCTALRKATPRLSLGIDRSNSVRQDMYYDPFKFPTLDEFLTTFEVAIDVLRDPRTSIAERLLGRQKDPGYASIVASGSCDIRIPDWSSGPRYDFPYGNIFPIATTWIAAIRTKTKIISDIIFDRIAWIRIRLGINDMIGKFARKEWRLTPCGLTNQFLVNGSLGTYDKSLQIVKGLFCQALADCGKRDGSSRKKEFENWIKNLSSTNSSQFNGSLERLLQQSIEPAWPEMIGRKPSYVYDPILNTFLTYLDVTFYLNYFKNSLTSLDEFKPLEFYRKVFGRGEDLSQLSWVILRHDSRSGDIHELILKKDGKERPDLWSNGVTCFNIPVSREIVGLFLDPRLEYDLYNPRPQVWANNLFNRIVDLKSRDSNSTLHSFQKAYQTNFIPVDQVIKNTYGKELTNYDQ